MTQSIAYGFMDSQHLFNTRIAELGIETTMQMIEASTAEYTRIMNEMLGLFVERTTLAMEQVELPNSATLQPLDEWGIPRPVLPSGNYQVGYPIIGGGIGAGFNRITNQLATVEEVNRWTLLTMQADANWLMQQMLYSIFEDSEWTFADKTGAGGTKGLGNITIKPLANGDAVTYLRRGAVAPSTDTHFLAQSAAIADGANPFPTIRSELDEHPSNAGPFVAYIASDLVATATALTEFVEAGDPDIALGSASDTLTSTGAAVLGPGDEVLGKTKSGIWLVEWGRIPSGYMVAMALGGTGGPILKMREYPSAALQGLFPEMHSPKSGQSQISMLRYAGFGAYNRVGAVVYRIGNASYAPPSGYTAPQPQ